MRRGGSARIRRILACPARTLARNACAGASRRRREAAHSQIRTRRQADASTRLPTRARSRSTHSSHDARRRTVSRASPRRPTRASAAISASRPRAPSPAAARCATLIAMDAPPPQEDCRPFVRVAALLADAGVHAPRGARRRTSTQGFLLLTDLGTTTYLDALDDGARRRALPRRDRRARALAGGVARGRAAAVRRGAAAPRARALSRLVRRAPPRPHAATRHARAARRRRSRASSPTTSRSRACSCTATTTRAT